MVGGRGYWTQQQVEDLIRLLGVVANPLDDEYLFGALASFANGVSPDALWLLRQAARAEGGSARHVWPLLEWRYGDGREPRARRDGVARARSTPRTSQRLERFCAILAALRAEAPLLTLEALVERTMNAFGYDLGLIARAGGVGPDGERAQADAAGARVRGERGPRPRRLSRARRRRAPRATSARAWPRSRPRATTASG